MDCAATGNSTQSTASTDITHAVVFTIRLLKNLDKNYFFGATGFGAAAAGLGADTGGAAAPVGGVAFLSYRSMMSLVMLMALEAKRTGVCGELTSRMRV